MPRAFSQTTAELLVEAVEAVFVLGREADVAYVAAFTDQPAGQAEDALKMAQDLGFVAVTGTGAYLPDNPLCRYLVSPNVDQKAAVVRITLDSYQPFLVFKERLAATSNVSAAAEQTKAILDLDAHRSVIKDTLISLGGYGQLLDAEGGGSYRLKELPAVNPLRSIADACNDTDATERTVRDQLGPEAVAFVSEEEVIRPLADGLWKARGGDSSGAIQQAGNAVESFLETLGTQVGANMTNAHGLNAKAARLETHGTLPPKLLNVSKYLGHVRNAADHGVDTDVGASWDMTNATGLQYVFVSCSFIASVIGVHSGSGAKL